ncbi:MAG: ribulose bisphosphate carboxylase small subunit [Phormidesmis sp.]
MANPQVHPSADVHEFSLIEGDVHIRSGTTVAPGVAVTAESGASIAVGVGCALLPGVIVEGIAGAQVMSGRDPCSVWLGDRTVVAHKAIIHSPAFIGNDCFVGFRSTVFNARLGDGCVVMMHALVQDVEIPPGKCVPSGRVITSQYEADQLPNVRSEDRELAKEITGVAAVGAQPTGAAQTRSPRNVRGSNRRAKARLVPINSRSPSTNSRASRQTPSSYSSPRPSYATEGAPMQAQRLAPEIVQQVRQYLSQGYRIGMEHADKRRYRSGVWETCTPIKDTREQAVFADLERCLAEHEGEYVRMFGIDPKAKSRVGMVTVQRPGDHQGDRSSGNAQTSSRRASSSNQSGYSSNRSDSSSTGGSGLVPGVVKEVRNLLNSGYSIGTEHAGPRHYRSNVWKVCSPIESNNEREVFSRLEHCLDEHSGEYVRMFGIDPQAKSRTATTTIQRADGKPVEVSASSVPNASGAGQSQSGRYSQNQSYSQNGGSSGSAKVDGDVAQAVSQIVRSGNKIGIEYADKRRYRSGIWQTAPSLKAGSESAATSQLQGFLDQHADKYVRIFSVNTQMKTRGASTTVQKPGKKSSPSQDPESTRQGRSGNRVDPINANPPHYDDPAFRGQPSSYNSNSYSDYNSGGMESKVMDQVTQLVNQGHKISIEYADKRRYRSGIWKTGAAISARRPAEAISALGKQLAQHKDNYVKLVGVDPQANRRVLETTIQRPGQGVSGTGPDPINANPPHYDDPAYRGQPSSYNSSSYSSSRNSGGRNSGSSGGSGANNGGMESKVMDQVTQLVNQGHKISLEYADKRRYRSGIWKTGEAIDARRPAEAISALGKQLAQHQGEYVRLIGVDPQAKRRVVETTIQRP